MIRLNEIVRKTSSRYVVHTVEFFFSRSSSIFGVKGHASEVNSHTNFIGVFYHEPDKNSQSHHLEVKRLRGNLIQVYKNDHGFDSLAFIMSDFSNDRKTTVSLFQVAESFFFQRV